MSRLFSLLLLPFAFSLSPVGTTLNPYVLSNLQTSAAGLTASLAYSQSNPGSTVIQNLFLNVTYVSVNSVRVQITNSQASRWEVPVDLMPYTTPSGSLNYKVTTTANPFGLQVTRNLDGKVVFNIDGNTQFQYNNQDIIWTNNLNYPFYTYGLGERVSSYRLQPGTYTIFTRDQAGPYDTGADIGANMYGQHPFYMGLDTSSGSAFGGFLLSSNAMDAIVGQQSVEYRFIGGIIDYFVFIGPTPLDVVQQYNALLGPAVLVPYWALGWHQCRWGYNSLTDLQTVVQNYQSNVIPLDVMWTDINYMLSWYDFTLDTSRYPQPAFSNWVDYLHSINMKFVPIVDAGVAAQNYFAYNTGTQANIFITAPGSSSPFIGQVWPGNAAWVDWFHPGAATYWWDMLDIFKQYVDFDGIWLDMNEASNFCYGPCTGSPSMQCTAYCPGNESNLNTKAIDLGAGHYGGIIEWDAHSLFGFMESRATSQYFTQHLNQRPFIISRSSFATHGRYASNWLGDNYSEWDYIGYSITGIFDFQMFGIPLIGADICGFNDNTTPELCSRWMQLGTLYPFSRNHNSQGEISQEPYALGPVVLQNSILAIRNKYSLMNYYYTLMYQASLSPVGGMIWKPALFNYPADSNLWDDGDHAVDNFMIGDALIVHPCLTQATLSISAYFPQDTWYDFYDGTLLNLPSNGLVTLETPQVGLINMHIRGGYIVPKLDSASSANTVSDLRVSNTTLVVALDTNGQATGLVIYDDGENVNSITNGAYTEVQYTYQHEGSKDTLTMQAAGGYTRANGEFPFVSMVTVYGCNKQPVRASMNGNSLQVLVGSNSAAGSCWVFFDDQVQVDQPTTVTIDF